MKFDSNLILQNQRVALAPLQAKQVSDLARVVSDPRIWWEFTWRKKITEVAVKGGARFVLREFV